MTQREGELLTDFGEIKNIGLISKYRLPEVGLFLFLFLLYLSYFIFFTFCIQCINKHIYIHIFMFLTCVECYECLKDVLEITYLDHWVAEYDTN